VGNIKLKTIKNHNQITRIKLLLLAVITTGLVALLLFGTTPDRAGPLGISLFFILVFLALLIWGQLLRHLIFKQPQGTSLLLIVLSSAGLVIALAIGTIEIQMGDIILLTLFIVTFTLYWAKLRK